MGDLIKEKEKGYLKTDFQEIQQFQQVWANVKIDGGLYDMIMDYSQYCPQLFTMVQKGIGFSDHKINLKGHIT